MIEINVEIYMSNLIGNIIDKINEYPESQGLVSVILTGSLGRNEGTFHLDENTSKVLLDSDVELALVYKSGKKKYAEIIKQKLIKDFSEEMNPMTISESRVRNAYNFNYSIIPQKKSSIFMYDLYHGSRTIWGEELLNKEIATYDKYEAKRIVANRIGELTYIRTTTKENVEELEKQWKGKLILAIGSAYCILENAYKSPYEKQRDYIVSQKKVLANVLGKTFVEDYEKIYLFLRKNEEAYDVPEDHLRKYVKNIEALFNKCSLKKPKINSFSRVLKYQIACIKSKSKFNPFTCEQDIIDNLIQSYIFNYNGLDDIAKSWKRILY